MPGALIDTELPADGSFVEAGRRAHVVWRLDGSFSGERDRSTEIVNPPGGGSEGVWVEPWRVADAVELALVLAEGGLAPLERYAVSYQREPGTSQIAYQLPAYPDLELVRRVWVPLHLPAVVVDLVASSRAEFPLRLALKGRIQPRLDLGWPVGAREAPRLVLEDDGVVAANRLGEAGLVVWPKPAAWQLDGTQCGWHVELGAPPGREALLRVVIAATAAGQGALRIARKVLRRADDLLAQRTRHYQSCLARAPRLSTPDADLDRAFGLARLALEDFKHHDPAIGLAYFAGFPAYNFYFSGDAFRMLYGACALGDWADSLETLRTIVRGQRSEDADGQLVGELWHELSTTGHAISPNFVTLELPQIVLHYARWSGDLDGVRELYPAAVRAAEWARRKDRHGDGLPDNEPEQTFADGVREDLNVAGAHLVPAAWQLRAYQAMAELARIVGEPGQVTTWRRRAARTARTIEARLWDATACRFFETIRPDGVADRGPGFVAAVEPDDPLDPVMRRAALEAELAEERLLRCGQLGSAAEYPTNARQSRAYYLMDRGDRARRLLLAGWAEDGVAALRSLARIVLRPPQAGFFPEIASRVEEAADPRGCFHQGWSAAYGLVHPVVAGLWGIRPSALERRLDIAPTPPADWDELRLEGLWLGNHQIDLGWRRLADGSEVVARCRGGPVQLVVWLPRPADGAMSRPRLTINGRRVRPRWRRGLLQASVVASVELRSGRPARVRVRWQPGQPPSRTRPVKHEEPVRPAGIAVPSRQAADHRPEVVYCGFLAPPFDGLDLRHVPINYAARRPAALLDLLPAARVVVLTDQQDTPLPASLAAALSSAVAEDGRSLLFFCYWSAAWGRGFFDTYCSIAESSIAQLLPLRFERGIGRTSQLSLAGPGQTLWADLPWSTAPPLDYNRASLVPDAVCWARAADGTPVAASHVVGRGRVVAIGLDGFGFGHGTLVGWAGQRPLLRRALDWLRGGV